MVKASDIRDRGSLERWLAGRSQSDAVAIAQRAAVRVLPYYTRVLQESGGAESRTGVLALLRLTLTTSVAQRYPTPGKRRALAARAAAHARAADAAADAADAAIRADPRARVDTISYALDTVTRADEVAAGSSAPTDYSWEQIRDDAYLLERGTYLASLRLWTKPEPGRFRQADTDMRAFWRSDGRDRWEFWIRWWEGVVSGHPVNWDIQQKVALLSDDIWQQGPDSVAAEIAALDGEIGSFSPDSVGNEPKTHEAALRQNSRVVRMQLEALRAFVEDEVERLRGANSLSSREHAALTQRLEMLAKIIEAVALMREAFEEDASGTNALVVVEAQLPAVVEAADNAVAGGGAPEVSAAIVSMATTIKYLTDAGTPGNYATGIAFADMCLGKIKAWWTRK